MLVQHDRNSSKSCLMSYYVWHFKVTYSSISGISTQHSSHILFSSNCSHLPVSGSNIYDGVGTQVDSISHWWIWVSGYEVGHRWATPGFSNINASVWWWTLFSTFVSKFPKIQIPLDRSMSWFKSVLFNEGLDGIDYSYLWEGTYLPWANAMAMIIKELMCFK